MRTKLTFAALAVGAAAAFLPVAPASAQCDPDPLGGARCNSCIETGNTIDKVLTAVDDRVAAVDLPGYWDLFACTMS